MAILDELERRGLLADVTQRDELAKLLASERVTLYAGYDPTSASLHVGSLVPTILLKRFQLAGHRPIVVVGGATGMVGDPSGKSAERNLLDDATLAANLAGIRRQLSMLLDFEHPETGALLVNNADWTRGVNAIDFLRELGSYMTVGYMRAKDSVKTRLDAESGMSFTEFSYMMLQAFDFVHLSRAHGCRLQVGGSDQYGNITAGCELSRKMGGPQLYGMTAPLLLDASGAKMGKTAAGTQVWLDAERTPPDQFRAYFAALPDADAIKLVKLFSLRPIDELEGLIHEHERDPSRRLAQDELARAMSAWVHPEAA